MHFCAHFWTLGPHIIVLKKIVVAVFNTYAFKSVPSKVLTELDGSSCASYEKLVLLLNKSYVHSVTSLFQLVWLVLACLNTSKMEENKRTVHVTTFYHPFCERVHFSQNQLISDYFIEEVWKLVYCVLYQSIIVLLRFCRHVLYGRS
jgi:hypothetical protein